MSQAVHDLPLAAVPLRMLAALLAGPGHKGSAETSGTMGGTTGELHSGLGAALRAAGSDGHGWGSLLGVLAGAVCPTRNLWILTGSSLSLEALHSLLLGWGCCSPASLPMALSSALHQQGHRRLLPRHPSPAACSFLPFWHPV